MYKRDKHTEKGPLKLPEAACNTMLKLGSISLDVPFYQAPLSGYTDRAMRVLAHKYGAPLSYTGVILAKIALHKKAFNRLFFQPSGQMRVLSVLRYSVLTRILMAEAAACIFKCRI